VVGDFKIGGLDMDVRGLFAKEVFDAADSGVLALAYVGIDGLKFASIT